MFIKIQNGSLFNTEHAKCFYRSSHNHTENGDTDVFSYYIEAESIIPSISPFCIGTFSTKDDRDTAFNKLTQALDARSI